jgi:hypothetical protein
MDTQLTRRELLKSGSTGTVIAAVGVGGLLSMLANRQAVAAGAIIAVVGVTSDVGDRNPNTPGAAHRHTFDAGFFVRSINPNTGVITGDLFGQTRLVIETGPDDEEFHIHPIRLLGVRIGDTVNTRVADFHAHSLHVD